MSVPATTFASLPACTPEMLAKIGDAQSILLAAEQIEVVTEHVLHGGMYARTIRLAPGVIITGALIKVPTVLIVNGFADVLVGDEWAQVIGYAVVPASAGRKQIFVTRSEVEMTMIFHTDAQTVAEAEDEFTDDSDQLMSRRSTRDVFVVTGE